jgi:hypothetical protein
VSLNANGGDNCFISIDGGNSWTGKQIGDDTYTEGVYIHGSNLFVVRDDSIYKSADQGNTWTSFLNPGIEKVENHGNKLLSTKFVSVDGIVWTDLNLPFFCDRIRSDGTTILATATNGDVYTSTDALNWNQTTSTPSPNFYRCIHVLGNYLFLGTQNGLFQSIDGGDSWTLVTGLPNKLVNAMITLSNNELLINVAGLLYSSSNSLSNWSETSDGFCASTITSFLYANNNLYAATAYGLYMSSDEGTTWTLKSDQYFWQLGSRNNILFAIGGFGTLFSSTDGVNWQALTGCQSYVFIQDTLFIPGTTGVQYSLDYGNTWNSISAGNSSPFTNLVYENNFLYAHDNTNLFRSSDRGQNWIQLTPGVSSFTHLYVDGNHVYQSLGFSNSWVSYDNGDNWQEHAYGLGVLESVESPFGTGPSKFVLGNIGQYFGISYDNGVNWIMSKDYFWRNLDWESYPYQIININEDIYIGTKGHGIYKRPLPKKPSITGSNQSIQRCNNDQTPTTRVIQVNDDHTHVDSLEFDNYFENSYWSSYYLSINGVGTSKTLAINPLPDYGAVSTNLVVRVVNYDQLSDSIVIPFIVTENTAIPQIIMQNSDTLVCSIAGIEYQWSIDDVIMNDTTRKIKASTSGLYKVKVKDINNCLSDASSSFNFNAVSISDPQENNGIAVFPLPATNSINVNFTNPNQSDIRIFNSFGACVYSGETDGAKSMNINISHLPAGVYLMEFSDEDTSILKKIIIQ